KNLPPQQLQALQKSPLQVISIGVAKGRIRFRYLNVLFFFFIKNGIHNGEGFFTIQNKTCDPLTQEANRQSSIRQLAVSFSEDYYSTFPFTHPLNHSFLKQPLYIQRKTWYCKASYQIPAGIHLQSFELTQRVQDMHHDILFRSIHNPVFA